MILASVLSVIGCASPVVPPSPAGPTPLPTIYLRPMQGRFEFCPLAALPPPPITFLVDPIAPWPGQTVAVDGRDETHYIFWAAPFTGGTADEPVVRGPDGEVAVRDGDIVDLSVDGQPTINGYPVCSGGGFLYVMSSRQT